MNEALYLTIWISLALFAAGEIGRARLGAAASGRAWPWRCWAAGIVLCAIHFALVFEIRHDWSQASAMEATAVQAARVYGLAWGGGVFVNYLFLAVWILDAAAWRVAPGRARSPLLQWALRAFYFIVILNGAVIFAAGARRVLGVVIVGAMVATWVRPGGRELQDTGVGPHP